MNDRREDRPKVEETNEGSKDPDVRTDERTVHH